MTILEALHPWRPKRHVDAPAGVQRLLHWLLDYIIAVEVTPEHFFVPPLQQLADDCGVAKSTISKWIAAAERGSYITRLALHPAYPNSLRLGLVAEETEPKTPRKRKGK